MIKSGKAPVCSWCCHYCPEKASKPKVTDSSKTDPEDRQAQQEYGKRKRWGNIGAAYTKNKQYNDEINNVIKHFSTGSTKVLETRFRQLLV